MKAAELNAVVAERVMGWKATPDRFLTGGRGWIPRWRFQPAKNIGDALQLLSGAAPQEYSICGDEMGRVHVRVRIAGMLGEARGSDKPLTITYAVARAVGIEVES